MSFRNIQIDEEIYNSLKQIRDRKATLEKRPVSFKEVIRDLIVTHIPVEA